MNIKLPKLSLFRHKVESETEKGYSEVEVNRWNTLAQTAWRAKYDRDRSQAVVEARSCGKCIEGIVFFGPGFDDQAACRLGESVCKFTKKDPTR
jgi:hypothetical protein